MKQIALLHNTIQKYAWGSLTAIPELMGEPSPASEPHAELWMGAHPKASSRVVFGDRQESLANVIADNPVDVLGQTAAKKFGHQMPYLFKVLAAAQPLSIQAHPSLMQAKIGFEKENRRGIPLDAPERNYRDDNHKPECICALTNFWALNGFRKIPEIITYIESCCPKGLEEELKILRDDSNADRLKVFFGTLMSLKTGQRRQVISETLAEAKKRAKEDDTAFHWVVSLHQTYPSDIGVLAPLILNLVCLEPGQAMFLQAGELHAYLDGLGIELMANSDNVLRGGLTPKHIDLQELMRVLNFSESVINILSPRKIREYELAYDTPAEEFSLSVICPPPGRTYQSPTRRGVEILLCTDGRALITDIAGHETKKIRKGSSVIVPAAVEKYHITGEATLYKASVPLA